MRVPFIRSCITLMVAIFFFALPPSLSFSQCIDIIVRHFQPNTKYRQQSIKYTNNSFDTSISMKMKMCASVSLYNKHNWFWWWRRKITTYLWQKKYWFSIQNTFWMGWWRRSLNWKCSEISHLMWFIRYVYAVKYSVMWCRCW